MRFAKKLRNAIYFAGSGGAILGLLLEEEKYDALKRAYESEGFVVTRVVPNFGQV